MSLLTACQNVADELGLVKPSTILSNTEETAVRLLALAKRSGLAIKGYHDWTFLTIETTIATVASTSSYALPSDFDRFVVHTDWDRTNKWRLYGPLTPAQWQSSKSGLATSASRRLWRLRPVTGANKFYVDPTPTAVETLAYEYISNKWAITSGATTATLTLDADTVLFDQELWELDIIWRMLRVLGQPYADEKQEAIDALDAAVADDRGAKTLSLSHQGDIAILGANVPDQGFG